MTVQQTILVIALFALMLAAAIFVPGVVFRIRDRQLARRRRGFVVVEVMRPYESERHIVDGMAEVVTRFEEMLDHPERYPAELIPFVRMSRNHMLDNFRLELARYDGDVSPLTQALIDKYDIKRTQ